MWCRCGGWGMRCGWPCCLGVHRDAQRPYVRPHQMCGNASAAKGRALRARPAQRARRSRASPQSGFACRAKQISTRIGSVVAAGKREGRRQPARKGPTLGWQRLAGQGSRSDRRSRRRRRPRRARGQRSSVDPGSASRGAPSRHPYQAEHVPRGTFATHPTGRKCRQARSGHGRCPEGHPRDITTVPKGTFKTCARHPRHPPTGTQEHRTNTGQLSTATPVVHNQDPQPSPSQQAR